MLTQDFKVEISNIVRMLLDSPKQTIASQALGASWHSKLGLVKDDFAVLACLAQALKLSHVDIMVYHTFPVSISPDFEMMFKKQIDPELVISLCTSVNTCLRRQKLELIE